MAELITKRLRHRLILCGLLVLGAYLIWYQFRLGTMREILNLEVSSLLGMNMPWLTLLSVVYGLGCVLYLFMQRYHGWARLVSWLLILPSASLSIILSVMVWPVIEPRWPVTDYVLPELSPSGPSEQRLQEWEASRTSLLRLFSDEIYGHTPTIELTPQVVSHERAEPSSLAHGFRYQSRLTFAREGHLVNIDLLYLLPRDRPRGIFLMANFLGNHTITSDQDIRVSENSQRIRGLFKVNDNGPSPEALRGHRESRWPIDFIIARGYGLATFHYADLVPDQADPEYGLPFLFSDVEESWGAIGMWAWGYSRVLDYLLEETRWIDIPVIAAGHSRLGKTALWAAAQDQRFAAVISNNSGCLGAALSRREYGETIEDIVGRFPYWFAPTLHKYRGNEEAMPVDQHQLLALVAPRPLYVASAEQDRWADPEGEYLATAAASLVYSLYGLETLWSDVVPNPDTPIGGFIGYHLRTGGHDVTYYDWQEWLKWADRYIPQ